MSLRDWYRYSFLYWLSRRREALLIWLAWKVPRPVAYWVFIRMASATSENPGDRTCDQVLKQHQAWVR